jgi:sulfotransferase family protein
MPALVEVVEVEVSDVSHDALAGFDIDQPKRGSERASYSLVVRGWALGREAPVEAVELVHDGQALRTLVLAGNREDVAVAHPDVAGAANCEFYAAISSLRLAPEFEIDVRAVLSDGVRVTIGIIRGRRASLRSAFSPRLTPLMLTSTGRAGSTVMMNALGAHPAIAVYPPFRQEPRATTYWMEIFTTLSEPASYMRQLNPGMGRREAWWLGAAEPMPRTSQADELERWMGAEAVESLAAVCQERIDALYSQVAQANGRPNAIYFAEKLGLNRIPALMWELYPRIGEVFLVRDFRDVACSILASSAKRQGRDPASDPTVVLHDIEGRTHSILRAWRERSGHAHLVRYEDLIERPADILEELAGYLELDSSPEIVGSMVSALSEGGTAATKHRTTPGADVSIGRWRRDLDADAQRKFERALRPGLEAFGYELETT